MDMNVVQKRLEEAGMYDKNLKDDEMMTYYKALKESEFDVTNKQTTSEPESMDALEDSLEDLNMEDLNDTKTVPIRKKLNLLARRREFFKNLDSLHPLLCDEFNSKSLSVRSDLVYQYHLNYSREQAMMSRLSLLPAPTAKLITCSKSISFDKSDADVEPENTYVSRSGRQTKRKNYTESGLAESKLSKKSKQDDDVNNSWLNSQTSKIPVKPTPRTPLLSLRKTVPNESSNDSPSDNSDEMKNTPRRASARKNLSNKEIMSRSSLFSDNGTPARKNILMEKTKIEIEKKKQEEFANEKFEKSLIDVNENENLDEIICVDEPFVKVRVEPKVPKRFYKKKAKANELDVVIEPSTSKKQLVNNAPSTSQVNKDRESAVINCPICSESFTKDTIEEHASTCGDSQEDNSPPVNVLNTKEISTCEICDKVLPLDTNYEVHVRDCIRKRKLEKGL